MRGRTKSTEAKHPPWPEFQDKTQLSKTTCPLKVRASLDTTARMKVEWHNKAQRGQLKQRPPFQCRSHGVGSEGFESGTLQHARNEVRAPILAQLGSPPKSRNPPCTLSPTDVIVMVVSGSSLGVPVPYSHKPPYRHDPSSLGRRVRAAGPAQSMPNSGFCGLRVQGLGLRV